jgi:hypothetical protein
LQQREDDAFKEKLQSFERERITHREKEILCIKFDPKKKSSCIKRFSHGEL